MSFVIGRGRYARAVYPVGPGGGGGGVSSTVPLSRQRFIDGDTTQAGLTGAAASPFKTIAQFIASRGNASVADATANYVGWVMPALNGYPETVFFPPYVSTELRADSLVSLGTAVIGSLSWDNSTPGAHSGAPASVAIHNIVVSGIFSVVDAPGAPPLNVVFGGDELGGSSAALNSGFVSAGTTTLESVSFFNAVVGGVNAGSTAQSALVSFTNSLCSSVIAGSLAALNSTFTGNITVSTGGLAAFVGCQFTLASNPSLDCRAGATFDGPSWKSFIEAGGTRFPISSDVGTPALVQGGYNGGAVEGAALIAAATNVSLNGTNASAGFKGSNSGNHYSATTLAQDSAVTLKTGGGEHVGDTILITKTDLTAHTLQVKNNAGAVLGVIPSGSRGFVLAQFNGVDWTFSQGGSLAA